MDPFLQLLGESTPAVSVDQIVSTPTLIPRFSDITLMTATYFENQYPRETWMKSNQAFGIQFFTIENKFTPHFSLADRNCTAQFHKPDFVFNYLDSYRRDNEGMRVIPTKEHIRWFADLTNETVSMGEDVRLGQLYDFEGSGTTYHWGSAVRLRVTKFEEVVVDLFLDCKLVSRFTMDEVNMDKNPKTANIKLRGRYDPRNLWLKKSTKSKKVVK